MWKCLSRSLRTFEKNVHKVNSVPTTKVTQDSKTSGGCILQKLSPVFTERFSRFYNSYKSCDCGEDRKEKQRREYRAKEGTCLNDLHCDWLDALQWSTALMLGWYMCLPYRRRHSYLKTQEGSCPCKPFGNNSNSNFSKRLLQYLTHIVIVKPVSYVLPQVKAVKTSQAAISKSAAQEETEDVGVNHLAAAHSKVLGSLSNWLGTESMRKGNHQQAFAHFNDAIKSNHAAGAYNMGICYELGLGTRQDFNLAAKFYKRASDLGHATAMYNLGVFHVHGWGNVDADISQARKLFQQAADLGQKDAKLALAAQSTSTSDVSDVETEGSDFVLVSENPAQYYPDPQMTDTTDHWYQLLNIKLDDIQTPKSRLVSTDSGVLDMSPQGEDSPLALF